MRPLYPLGRTSRCLEGNFRPQPILFLKDSLMVLDEWNKRQAQAMQGWALQAQ
jgi:hypothetical protein